ncbi:MAG TPA: extracellular solute-binding protein [Halothiobacillaceae bacterium]|nr:extracellular solute-binding protein [Halothiobacillaceae bacterium]
MNLAKIGLSALLIGSALILAGCSDSTTEHGAAQETQTINIYSARKEDLIRPILERFTEDTGIETRLLTADAGALLSRLENEGINTPADMLITVDAGNLNRAKEAGILAPLESEYLAEVIPAHLRDEDNYWYGLSKRARVIFVNPEMLDPAEIQTYEDLADPRFKGQICIRSSDNIYNQSLVASMIAEHGEEYTQKWAEGLVNNFARDPQGGDRDQIRAAAAGRCAIAVANTYYFGAMQNGSAEDRAVTEKLELVWPNQNDRGAHVNVSGAGLVSASNNAEAVRALIEYLATADAQQWYAQVNNEHPVNPNVAPSETLAGWGEFKADDLNLSQLGELNADAVRLMDRAGWR